MAQEDQGSDQANDVRLHEIHSIALAEILTKSGRFDHWKYYDELAELKRRPLQTAWLEAYVMVCAIGRIRPAKVTGFCKKLREKRDKTNDRALFDDFMKRLQTYLHPLVLTNHGFREANFESIDHGHVWSHVGELMEQLEKAGFEVFLNSGTLLGVTREKALIGHDDDVDLAVVLDASTEEEAAEEWLKLRDWLDAQGLCDKERQRAPEIHKLTSIGDMEVDLFPAWVQGGQMFVYPHTYGDLPAGEVLPLRPCEVTGHKVPKTPEKMLELNYGSKWQEPDPLFKFPWASANEKFDTFLKAVQ